LGGATHGFLSRDVAFISGMMAHRVPFIVPEVAADPPMPNIYAALARASFSPVL
jgi:hypothetical protein